MKRIKRIKRIKNIENYPILKQWIEGSTLAQIGDKLGGVSRQAVKQKLDKEAEEVYLGQKFEEWFRDIIRDEKTNKSYAFLSFKDVLHGKFYAYMLKKHFGYHVVDGEYATRDNLNVQKIRTEVIASIKEHGLPMFIKTSPKDNPFAFNDISFFAGEKNWDKFFYVSKENSGYSVFAFKGESLLYNVCEWLKKDTKLSVEEAFGKLPKALKVKNKVSDAESFISYLKERKNYLYEFDEDIKKKLLLFIGVEVGKRSF